MLRSMDLQVQIESELVAKRLVKLCTHSLAGYTIPELLHAGTMTRLAVCC